MAECQNPQSRIFFALHFWVEFFGRYQQAEINKGFYLIVILLVSAFVAKTVHEFVFASHTKMIIQDFGNVAGTGRGFYNGDTHNDGIRYAVGFGQDGDQCFVIFDIGRDIELLSAEALGSADHQPKAERYDQIFVCESQSTGCRLIYKNNQYFVPAAAMLASHLANRRQRQRLPYHSLGYKLVISLHIFSPVLGSLSCSW